MLNSLAGVFSRRSGLFSREMTLITRAKKKKAAGGKKLEGPATFEETVMAWEKFSGEKIDFTLPWTKGNEPAWIKTILNLPKKRFVKQDVTKLSGMRAALKQERVAGIKLHNQMLSDGDYRLISDKKRYKARRLSKNKKLLTA